MQNKEGMGGGEATGRFRAYSVSMRVNDDTVSREYCSDNPAEN